MEINSIIIALICAVLGLIIKLMRKPNKLNALPGPVGLPIVGYIPFLTKKPFVKLTELSSVYGPVYSLPLGSKQILVVTNFECIKEALESETFIGRPPDTPIDKSKDNMRTNAFLGFPCKEQRRFYLRNLKDLGFAKTQMEKHLKEEVLHTVARTSQLAGKTVTIFDLLAISVSNTVASLLFDRRLRHDDPKRIKLTRIMFESTFCSALLNWYFYFPWIRKVLKYLGVGRQGRLVRCIKEVKDFCRQEINEHEANLNTSNDVRDFVDGYLLEIEKRCHITDTPFKKEVLVDLCRSFFGAGSDTIRVTLEWFFLVLAARPDVQARILAEVDRVLGPDRFPDLRDRPEMPYTEAALWEVMRWKTVIPINTMRFTIRDTVLNGHFIPKATEVLFVPWAVDHNESLWGPDVSEYRPERFLNADGTRVLKPQHFFPFSIGQRYCPGKPLADLALFVYITSILQKFEVRLPKGKEADFEGYHTVAYAPKRQELCFQYRR